MKPTIDSPHTVDGYQRCRCGIQVPEPIFYATGAMCMGCFAAGEMRGIHEIEVLHMQQRVPVKIKDSSWKPRPKRMTPTRKATKKRNERAQLKALRRLRMLFPELYDVLYAEERHKIGMAPVAQRDAGHYAKAVATYEAWLAYSSGGAAQVEEAHP